MAKSKAKAFDIDERVLAWIILRSWGNGRDLACCRILDLHVTSRADVLAFDVFMEDQIQKRKEELVVASQQQCAFEIDVPVQQVHAAVRSLVKQGRLTTMWVNSPSWQTKHKIGVGFRAVLVNKRALALCPTPAGNRESKVGDFKFARLQISNHGEKHSSPRSRALTPVSTQARNLTAFQPAGTFEPRPAFVAIAPSRSRR